MTLCQRVAYYVGLVSLLCRYTRTHDTSKHALYASSAPLLVCHGCEQMQAKTIVHTHIHTRVRTRTLRLLSASASVSWLYTNQGAAAATALRSTTPP